MNMDSKVIRGVDSGFWVEFLGRIVCPSANGQCHSHVVVQRPPAVVVDNFLPRALSLAHRLQAPVPMEQLEDGHQLLEFQHCLVEVRLEHVAEGCNSRCTGVCLASGNL